MSLIKKGLLIGNYKDASDLRFLSTHRVTHILCSAAELSPVYPGRFKYKHVVADDVPYFNLSKHFDAAADFINEAIKSNGVVLVHCAAGISRSVTLATAYLMKHERMKAATALSMIRSRRFIANPNPGFVRQLREYESRLEEIWSRQQQQQKQTETHGYRPVSQGLSVDRQGARRTVGPEQEYMARSGGFGLGVAGVQLARPSVVRGYQGGGMLRTPTESWLIQKSPEDPMIDAALASKSTLPGSSISKTYSGGFGATEKVLTRNASMRPTYGTGLADSRYQPTAISKPLELRNEEAYPRMVRDPRFVDDRYAPQNLQANRSRLNGEANPRLSANGGTQTYTSTLGYTATKAREWEATRKSPRNSMTATKAVPSHYLRQSVGGAGFGIRSPYSVHSHPTSVLVGSANTYYIR